MEDNERNQTTADLFRELKEWETSGRRILFDGYPASPMQVANASMVRENCTFMKNYSFDQKGDVEEIQVDTVPLDDEK